MKSNHIATIPGQKMRENHRPLCKKKWGVVQKEVEMMRALGVVEESRSEQRSPIVLVPKPDRVVGFCIDFRRVKAISWFDTYPMPREDELLKWLGNAKLISVRPNQGILANPSDTSLLREDGLSYAFWPISVHQDAFWLA